MPRIVDVIVNSSSGLGPSDDRSDLLRDEFAKYDLEARFHHGRSGDEIVQLASAAAASDAETLIAVGGDGTISAVAAEAHKSRKKLGVIPTGTLNNFSKDLGIPQDVAEAVRVVAEGCSKHIDIARVNGRCFINNSSIGLYPRIVKKRVQQQRLGYGKWRAAFWAALRMFRLSPFVKVRIELDGKSFLRKTPFVFVGNNEYEMELYNIGRRPRLDGGKLSIYFLHRGGRWGIVLLLLHTFTGHLRQWLDFEEVMTESVSIQTRRKRLPVAFDGEVDLLSTPLEYEIVPNALEVIVPRKEEV
jgi:diacylglycerol kinase family enzyme